MLSALRYQIDNKDLTPNVKIKNKAKHGGVQFNPSTCKARAGEPR